MEFHSRTALAAALDTGTQEGAQTILTVVGWIIGAAIAVGLLLAFLGKLTEVIVESPAFAAICFFGPGVAVAVIAAALQPDLKVALLWGAGAGAVALALAAATS